MTLNSNQFKMETVAGELDLQFNSSVVSGKVSANQVAALIAGQGVKIEDSSTAIPSVLASGAGDEVNAFVIRNLKDANFPTDARVELAMAGSVMYMTANGAIPRWAKVEYDPATGKVGVSAGVNQVVGRAYDKALADGDLIRVEIIGTPNSSMLRSSIVTATLAEINAGKVLIAGQVGKKLRVVGIVQRVTGGFTTVTSVRVQSSNAAPVIVTDTAVAALTNGAVIVPGTANNTLGAGFAADLGTGDGLVVAKNGADAAVGTSIQYTITYAFN